MMFKISGISAMIAAVATAGGAVPASRVCVANMGGYDLNWYTQDLITGAKSATSDTYPID